MGVDDFFNPPGDADFDPEPDLESGSPFDEPDPDPDYDDDDPDPNSEDDPDCHSDDDPNPEFVFDSDPDPDFVSNSDPDSGSDFDPNSYSTLSYASSTAQILTSRLTTLTLGPDCSYCGDSRHTCETCFKSHGYPNWWATLTDRGQCNMTSNAVEKETDVLKRDKEKSKDGEEKEEMPAEVIAESIELAKEQQEAQRTEATSS
ncbi:hypothetical protein L3X38_015284 [Prunus dulcis]|uniref:Uncharacterized protein n=1 Tax=Prunus dulcis TaxID=3755 RepID=A0AAD4WPU4_PRUDU|nr:hypothetical protein L3X38_015284 [Prunus dulcis]